VDRLKGEGIRQNKIAQNNMQSAQKIVQFYHFTFLQNQSIQEIFNGQLKNCCPRRASVKLLEIINIVDVNYRNQTLHLA